MGPPTIWMRVRQTLGRALRETAQALDRVAMRARQHALTDRLIGDDPYRFDDHLSRHRHLFPLIERGKPVISDDVAYLAPCSTLIGSVRVEAGASIWYKAILRADQCENGSSFVNSDEVEMKEPFTLDPERVETSRFTNRDIGGAIYIGENSNVQDGCIVTSNVNHARIGRGVTIGHMAQIHSATVKDYCLIGMGSILNENVVVESESFVAAGAVVESNTNIPSGELWVGHPARKLRDLSPEERQKLHYQANEVRRAFSQNMSPCCYPHQPIVVLSKVRQGCKWTKRRDGTRWQPSRSLGNV